MPEDGQYGRKNVVACITAVRVSVLVTVLACLYYF
jgi:hypothetical protein